MKKVIILYFLVLLLFSLFVLAHGGDTSAQAEDLIESKISCDQLSYAQLEIIGDYYMEQMHPGKTHEQMDAMMGGEGSEQLKQMHINMARSFYCGKHEMMGSGMMDMMIGRDMMNGNGDMMGSGMMKGKGGMMDMMGSGMMSAGTGWMSFYMFLGLVFWILVIIALILFIVWMWKKIQKQK